MDCTTLYFPLKNICVWLLYWSHNTLLSINFFSHSLYFSEKLKTSIQYIYIYTEKCRYIYLPKMVNWKLLLKCKIILLWHSRVFIFLAKLCSLAFCIIVCHTLFGFDKLNRIIRSWETLYGSQKASLSAL